MHLLGEAIGSLDKKPMMSGCGTDIRLRRQVPVSTRPPRVHLGTTAARELSSLQHVHEQRQQSKELNANYWHQSMSVSMSQNSAFSTVVSASENVKTLTAGDYSNVPEDLAKSQWRSQGDSDDRCKSNTNNRPLIHHQRHNLKTRFQLLKTLGEGTYGKVKLASDRTTGEHVAIKYIKKTKIVDENDLVRIRREIQILSSLRHKHIVNIREVFEKKDKIVLVMDYAQGGELYDYLNRLGKLSEWDARRIFRQIVSAIHYCHQNGIVHRDLKLENIILDDQGNVKIADFGLSNYFSHNSTLKTYCGSPLYASPEIVNGKPYHGPEVDVWSLGVILYTLVYGAMPFESNSLVSLKQQITEGDYSQPALPSDAAGLIRHMLTVTPSRRATMEDALGHWWINLGHSLMPNDAPYCLDDEPLDSEPHEYHTSPERAPCPPSSGPPTVLHQRNQSSISSDSDVELDFRPSRWSTRRKPLDSTGSSLSSSVGGSPAPMADSGSGGIRSEGEDDPAAIAAGLLKLPPEVLEILKGCSSKSLAALLNTDKISTGFDIDIVAEVAEGRPAHHRERGKEKEEKDKQPEPEVDKPITVSVFDSERKPKRGILKRKGKFSGGDSGCIVHEEMSAARSEGAAIPKSGHLPRRLPSFRDEAHGIFASRHRASQLILEPTESADCHVNNCNNNASIQTLWCQSSPCPPPCDSRLPQQPHNPHHDSCHHRHQRQPQEHRHQQQQQHQIRQEHLQTCDQICHHSQQHPRPHHHHPHPHQHLGQPAQSTAPLPPPLTPDPASLTQDSNDVNGNFSYPNELSDRSDNTLNIPAILSHDADLDTTIVPNSKEQSKVTRRPKSILKNSKLSQLDEARNRLSISSIGSNSSADILDLSYDSGDSDHFVNLTGCESPENVAPPSGHHDYDNDLHHPHHVTGEDRPSQSLAMTTGEFRGSSLESALGSGQHGCDDLLDRESSILYRLARDAQSLL